MNARHVHINDFVSPMATRLHTWLLIPTLKSQKTNWTNQNWFYIQNAY